MTRFATLLLLAASLLVSCGGDGDLSPYDDTTTIRVYWLLDDKVWPVQRVVKDFESEAEAAVAELLRGPSVDELADLEVSTAMPQSWEYVDIGLEGGVAHVELAGTVRLEQKALAQLVYTLTQFPDTESAEVGGETYTRADFEEQTPAILVESPLPFEEVGNPVEASGTANTFEATFAYELTDTDGRIVDEGFVTATSGTGTRGTFEFTTGEYEIPFDGVGSLIVFERSAKDGSRANLVEIPLRMTQ